MNSLTTSKILGYLAVIFLAGGTTGAVITLTNARTQESKSASMEKVCNRLQDRLILKLGLTSEQVHKLQPVFDESARELRAIHSKAMQETDGVLCKTHRRIAEVLTPEQKTKLECMDKERREWLRRRLKIRDTDSQPDKSEKAGPATPEL